MSTNCERCGYRDNEVKAGGAINEKGRKITLKVEDKEDLSRDILKVRSFSFCLCPHRSLLFTLLLIVSVL
jgi:C4-type Zn-finger protein